MPAPSPAPVPPPGSAPQGAGRWVAVTGTPGVGKSTLARALAAEGARVTDVTTLARDAGLLDEKDAARGSFIVDEDALADHFDALPRPDGVGFVDGHFAHELPVDLVVLLRLDPVVLVERLRARGWPEGKVRENVEAEALDVIAGEVLDTGVPCAEVDCTAKTVEEVAREVWAIVDGGTEALKSRPVGHVAWPLERVPWF